MSRDKNKRRRKRHDAALAAQAAIPQVTKPNSGKTAIANPNPRPKPSQNRDKWSWLTHGKGLIGFVAGVVATLFLQQWIVALLPGPKVSADVTGLQVTTGSASGCTSYTLDFNSDQALEYASGKIQFPNRIDDFKFGYTQESIGPNKAARTSMTLVELGRGDDGKCKILQGVPINSPGVQASGVGNVFGFSVTKMPDNEHLVGFIVTADRQSTINPPPALYSEGTYEYLKLGQPVRKIFGIINGGMSQTK